MIAIDFKLTEQERSLIEQKMQLAGVHNMSAYIRKMCIDGYTVNLQILELQECSRYLQSASNNINQIAKGLNSGDRYYAGELAEVENCLQENKKLFGAIFEQLSKNKIRRWSYSNNTLNPAAYRQRTDGYQSFRIGNGNVIAYHLRQSFKPGEITPERANKIGYELAMRLTKGQHPFIVCTHIDKAHIHSHIVFSAINLDCTRKFRNFWRSSFAIRKISDIFYLENGLSVIAEPQASRGSYADWLDSKGEQKPPTVRHQLEQIIDDKIAVCKDFNSFLKELQCAGIEVKQGRNTALKLPGAKRFVRLKSLGDAYSEAAIKARLLGKKQLLAQDKPNLLIDIQSKMQQANSPGYERWAKKFNLKEMAKTVMFLQGNNMLDYEVLLQVCADASEKYNATVAKTKANSERMKEISELQKHIGAYRKNRDIYAEYRKLAPKKQAAFYEQHRSQIVLCEAAKKFFDELGLQKLPGIQMLELLTARSNVERILGLQNVERQRERQRQQER